MEEQGKAILGFAVVGWKGGSDVDIHCGHIYFGVDSDCVIL